MDIPDWVIIFGLVFGSIAISSACWVCVAHRQFAAGGSVLSALGVVLIGLSIWKNVEVRAGIDGIEWRFEQLQAQVEAAESRAEAAELQAAEAVEQGRIAIRNAEFANDSLLRLTDQLRGQAVLEPGQLDALRHRLREHELPRADRGGRN